MKVLISDRIKSLPKSILKKWISEREKEKRGLEWEKALEPLKKALNDNAKRTGKKSEKD